MIEMKDVQGSRLGNAVVIMVVGKYEIERSREEEMMKLTC